MIALSTYSGECDGLGLAAEMAGITVAAYCEADPKRRAQLAKKHPGKPIFDSDELLTKEALDAHGIHPDIIFGGPPCQPFSCAGAQRGTADPRHRWPQMLRIIQECRPRWVLVENVGGFVRLALDLVWADLEAEGYEVGAVVLPALAIGAPHRRDRCFVVGHSQGGSVWHDGKNQRAPDREIHQPGDAGNGGVMADAIRPREPQPGGNIAQCRGWAVNGGKGVAYPESPKQDWEGRPRQGWTRLADRDRRPTQPGVLRDFDGLPNRLDAVMERVSAQLDEQMPRWPAWRGQEQHPWEPPRTVRGMKNRPRRVESLGLAVVPWQVYPMMALIKELDDMEGEGKE